MLMLLTNSTDTKDSRYFPIVLIQKARATYLVVLTHKAHAVYQEYSHTQLTLLTNSTDTQDSHYVPVVLTQKAQATLQ
jgi:hypothetical protein